jgi:hypothetical protein
VAFWEEWQILDSLIVPVPDHGSIVYARPPPTVEVLVDICSHILICAARIAAAVVAENNDVDYWRRCWN